MQSILSTEKYKQCELLKIRAIINVFMIFAIIHIQAVESEKNCNNDRDIRIHEAHEHH